MATEISSVSLLACDGGTTDQFLRKSTWIESNPVLGEHPSDVRLWGYLGAIAAAVIVANRKLPPKWALALNLFVTAAEVRAVAINMHVGASACGVGEGGPWLPSNLDTARSR